MKKEMQTEEIIEYLRSNGAGKFIRRTDVGKISNGLLHPATMANKDCQGGGPDSRVLFGQRVAYPIEALARYMKKKGFFIEQVV